MAVTATGNLSTSLALFRTLISIGTNFQAWTGTLNATAALARIYAIGTTTRTRPCVKIGWDSGSYRQLEGWSGMVEAIFEAETSAAYQKGGAEESDYASAAYQFTNYIGPIVEEICDNMESGGYPHISRNVGVSFKGGLARNEVTGNDFHQWTFMFPWGLQ